MELVVYICQETDFGEGLELTPRPVDTISEGIWQKLAANVAKEESLTAYPAAVLAGRWQQGRAAVAIKDREIISYISLVPVYTNILRAKLSAELGLTAAQLPHINIDESATGWTHPAWRQRRLSLHLRRKLLGQFSEQERLTVTIAVGLGAAPVVSKLNWQLLSWSDTPFVSSLVGLPVVGLDNAPQVGRRLPPYMKLYRGNHISAIENKNKNKDEAHNWSQFCHFWVSNHDIASRLDQTLASLTDNDLHRWRVAYSNVLKAITNPTWKPFLFDEDYG